KLYSTSNGQERDESGHLNKKGANIVLVIQGVYSYTGSDNKLRRVSYQADERGFHPHIEIISDSSKSPSLTTESNIVTMAPPTSIDLNVPVLRIASSAIATLNGGGLGK
ncbi:hypothetical protein NQ314_008609, partial [Rhamnusium bicolor]